MRVSTTAIDPPRPTQSTPTSTAVDGSQATSTQATVEETDDVDEGTERTVWNVIEDETVARSLLDPLNKGMAGDTGLRASIWQKAADETTARIDRIGGPKIWKSEV
jgi:hypothetical protein